MIRKIFVAAALVLPVPAAFAAEHDEGHAARAAAMQPMVAHRSGLQNEDLGAMSEYCLRRSTTRVRQVGRARQCGESGDFDRVYTREDIARTGAVDLAEALRMLSPVFY